VIKKFDNKTINNVRELLNVVGITEVGRKVKAIVIRDKKELNLEVEIGERPQNLEEVSLGSSAELGKWRGLDAQEINSESARRFSIEEKSGAVAVDVEPNSPADDAGIIPGDVILEINKQPIKNLSDYQKITKGLKGDALVRTSRGYFVIKGEE